MATGSAMPVSYAVMGTLTPVRSVTTATRLMAMAALPPVRARINRPIVVRQKRALWSCGRRITNLSLSLS